MDSKKENKFYYSRHGTSFLYPLQVRLFDYFDEEASIGNDLINIPHILKRLSRFNYSEKSIVSEINRCLYMATLTKVGVKNEQEYKITSFFKELLTNYYSEIDWQDKEILIRINRRSEENYTFIVRDTSFLNEGTRVYLNTLGFKPRPFFDIQKSRISVNNIKEILLNLLPLLTIDHSPMIFPSHVVDETDKLLFLIQVFGKQYASIKDKYVYYALPHSYYWNDSQIFRDMLSSILLIAHRPIEWRGKPFTKQEIFSDMEKFNDGKVRRYSQGALEHCFYDLLYRYFIREYSSRNKIKTYTIVGQGATWIEEYFYTIHENYSVLDSAIIYCDQDKYSVRLANASFLPSKIHAYLQTIWTRSTDEWIYVENLSFNKVVELYGVCSNLLTKWGKRYCDNKIERQRYR